MAVGSTSRNKLHSITRILFGECSPQAWVHLLLQLANQLLLGGQSLRYGGEEGRAEREGVGVCVEHIKSKWVNEVDIG